MHLLVLLLIFAVLLADSGVGILLAPSEDWRWLPLAIAIIPPLAGVLLELVLVRRTLREASKGSMRAIMRSGRRLRLLQWIAVGSTVLAVVGFGWLELVRDSIGNLVLLDELCVLLPCLVLICLAWSIQWPIERLVREAMVVRRLDRGLPIHPLPTVTGYVIGQVRIHLFVVLVPAAFVLACIEITESLLPHLLAPDSPSWVASSATGTAAVLALVLSPWGVLMAINARSMPEGATRESLEAVLRQSRVRVRDIRLWPTGGSILNGAVIGFVPPLRYVLLTDALIETLPAQELRAVMAHEVGHLRYRHLPWTAAILLAQVWLFADILDRIFPSLYSLLVGIGFEPQMLLASVPGVGVLLVLGLSFLGFGWVSRRFELQADAAAACALSVPGDDRPALVAPEAAGWMCGALESVARVNGLAPERHTWRHGSIRWRQQQLQRLIGIPIDRLPIDRRVRLLKRLAASTLLLLAALAWFDPRASDSSVSPVEVMPLSSSPCPIHLEDSMTRTPLRFTKMHGIGNDYVYIDLTTEVVDDPARLARLVSDRHRGIGSDGLILIEPLGPGSEADVRMHMFNADGSESEMCGNGIRCVAKFAVERGMATASTIRVATGAGVLDVEVHREGGEVMAATVDMGRARTTCADLPAVIPGLDPAASTIGLDIDLEQLLPGRSEHLADCGVEPIISLVSTGNPHLVSWCDALERIDLASLGPALERHPWFPERINVHFVRVDSSDRVSMRTWERGSGPTLACGTGASAVCVAAALEDRTGASITARLPGGALELTYDRSSGHVSMRGPAVEVYHGEIDPDRLEESA